MKNCGLSFETPLLFSSFSPFLLKRRTLLPHPAIRRFLLRTSVRANGHAPAHRALSEFEFLAFTLHLHPQFIDTVRFVCEGVKAKNRKTPDARATRARWGLKWDAGALLRKGFR